jgi:uncharacterized membrane protein
VPSDDDEPRARRALSKGRMEGFSDGVFGFAATLLGVDLAIRPPGTALHQVLEGWPSYLAYVISFLTIGTGWLAHTALTDRLSQTDPILLRLNLLVLMVVVWLPFPTSLFANALHDSSGERVFVTMYGFTLLAIRVLGATLDLYAQHEHLYSARTVEEDMRIDRRKRLPVIVAFLVVILIGLALPILAVALYFAIAVYAIVPFRYVTSLLFRRKSRPSPT